MLGNLMLKANINSWHGAQTGYRVCLNNWHVLKLIFLSSIHQNRFKYFDYFDKYTILRNPSYGLYNDIARTICIWTIAKIGRCITVADFFHVKLSHRSSVHLGVYERVTPTHPNLSFHCVTCKFMFYLTWDFSSFLYCKRCYLIFNHIHKPFWANF